ncbi:MAG: rhomboid family intramembrane serine protease [Elusimicrobia bacterium]|nr:rhomboid family intramembrane serine protease [Candidatus Obscuribacterium magneticum]
MTLLARLEKHVGWLAIPNLPLLIVATQGLIYVWALVNPQLLRFLLLDPVAIVQGHEYWRLLTYLFVPPVKSPLFAVFFFYLLYVYGMALENEWGSFSFTIFYLVGATGATLAAFFFGSVGGAFYLNLSVFLAFAAIHPDFELLLFFVLPLKIKWLALLTWIWLGYLFLVYPLPVKAAVVASLANYLLFFGGAHARGVLEVIRHYRHKRRFKNWNE